MLRRARRRLYVSPGRALLTEDDRRGRFAILECAELNSREPLSEIGPIAAAWARPQSSLRVRDVVIDDHWCRYFMVSPPTNATRPGDLQFAAGRRFESLYDEPLAEWAIEANWKARQAFLSCALYRPVLAAIDAAPFSRIMNVLPQTVYYCNRYLKHARGPKTWLLACTDARIVVSVFQKRAPVDVHRVALAPDFWSNTESFARFVEHVCLRLNRGAPDDVLLCGDVPESWTPARAHGIPALICREPIGH